MSDPLYNPETDEVTISRERFNALCAVGTILPRGDAYHFHANNEQAWVEVHCALTGKTWHCSFPDLIKLAQAAGVNVPEATA